MTPWLYVDRNKKVIPKNEWFENVKEVYILRRPTAVKQS